MTKLSLVEKVRLTQRNAEISNLVKESALGLREKFALLQERANNMKAMGIGAKIPEQEQEQEQEQEIYISKLGQQFEAGDFNNLTASELQLKIDEVMADNGTIEQVKAGVCRWMAANENLMLPNEAA